MVNRRALLAALVALAAPAPAAAACQVSRLLELPVTMVGQRPMVTARFGGKEARFILDSGAFHSTMSRASAAELGLRVEPAPPNFRLRGIGGDTSAGVAVARNVSLAGITIPRTDFIVGGSDTGTAGLLGQNILGLADVEYDLPHGVVRLMKTADCRKANLAYWAGTRPVTMLALEDRQTGAFKPHTIATVLINGSKVRAVFDTGAPSSLLSLAAAKRLGVTPDTPGVVPASVSSGLGTRRIPSWLATFASIDIGGEVASRPRTHIADVDFSNADMVIGADFFLTHRIFVSNAAQTMFLTYEGGPMFGLTPRRAVTPEGKALDLTDRSAEPTDAEGYSRRGAVLAANRRLEQALADFDKACALSPGEARYFRQRAMARLANRQPILARADLDRAITLSPKDADARLTRAGLRLGDGDRQGAADDLAAADAALPPTSDRRLHLAALDNGADRHDAALVNYDLWLKSHPEDSSRPTALNGRCWARALLNRELDKALSDCNAALRQSPGNPAFLDSRALVRLRRGDLKEALADYDRAIAGSPRNPWSLYARSVAEQRAGMAQQSAVDRAAALAIDPHVTDQAKRAGLEG